MRHDQSNTTPFDLEADEADELAEQFWGTTRGWVSREHPTVETESGYGTTRRDDTTGSLRAIKDGLAAFRPRRTERTGTIDRTREHGIVRQDSSAIPAEPEATLGELAAGGRDEFDFFPEIDATTGAPTQAVATLHRPTATTERVTAVEPEYHDDDLVPLTPAEPLSERLGLGAIDPLLLRLGLIVLIGVLLVPLALALRGGDDEGGSIRTGAPGAAVVPLVVPALEPSSAASPESTIASAAAADPASNNDGETSPAPADEGVQAAPSLAETTAAAAPAAVPEGPDPAPEDEAATVDAVAERIVPACPQTYEAAAGDSWYRIADAAGIAPAALLAENRATLDTTILPGQEICLTAEATVPSPPSTAPATVVATTDAPATTAAPTTAAPTTTAAPPVPPAPEEAQRIIREVWPDELEEKALSVAYRESRYRADAYNGWCCYGLFQIYWTVHDEWLDDFGIYSSNDLYDARKNTEAAYEIYKRAGGWGPWGG